MVIYSINYYYILCTFLYNEFIINVISLGGYNIMGMNQQEILEKILREIQDIRVIVQENSEDIDYLVKQDQIYAIKK